MRRIHSILFVILMLSRPLWAEEIPLADNPPQRYTVVKGDTLWDIAARFLRNPWQWPEIWHANPHIKDPHWIYPGDVIVLKWVEGQPQLTLQRGGAENLRGGTEKLQPQIRETPIEQAIPTIPYEAIRQFLTSPRVVTKEEIKNAPYIVSLQDNRIVGGTGDTIYVRGIEDSENTQGFTVFRRGKALREHKTKDILGYEAIYVADTQLEKGGDPATLKVTRSNREILVGDKLLPIQEEQLALNYQPRPPSTKIKGRIINVLDGVSQIGQYNIVVIDRGSQDGLEKGHVLAILRKGEKIRDSVDKRAAEMVKLPDEKAGLLLIFRPFEKVSYGIVMKATRAIHINDIVKNPEL
ncbi:MAG: peptidoglycan-binding protein [Methylothermaceae bacteria B42]|nr:MAG: peptidoglycan-binding protein [Methylothermaceae bacteria B42]HHJ39379.1 LysM peptidoglycan-binding domain-containing protein [Methylothermaceae bacterium]